MAQRNYACVKPTVVGLMFREVFGKFTLLLSLRQVTAREASLLGLVAVLPNTECTCWHDQPMQGHCRGLIIQSTENPSF